MQESKLLTTLRPESETSVVEQVNDDLASYFFTLLRTARLVQAIALEKFQKQEIDLHEFQSAVNASALDPRIISSITSYIKAAGALSEAGDVEKAMKELKQFETNLNTARQKIKVDTLDVDPL